MPRVTHVKRAQQRYATKPTLDPATGEQKIVPVMDKRTGEQKVTKHGRPVVLRVTERDLDRPLPMPECDYPGCAQPSREIAVGTPYKWIAPSGQQVRNRHAACPSWNVWEYSSSLSARIAQIQGDGPGQADIDDAESAQAWASSKADEIRGLADEIRGLADEKRDSAANIVDGFGHETYQSEELENTADELDGWADDLENVDLPEHEEAGEAGECDTCEGSGQLATDDEDTDTCDDCGGTGIEDPEEKLDEWREALQDALQDALDECPV